MTSPSLEQLSMSVGGNRELLRKKRDHTTIT